MLIQLMKDKQPLRANIGLVVGLIPQYGHPVRTTTKLNSSIHATINDSQGFTGMPVTGIPLHGENMHGKFLDRNE